MKTNDGSSTLFNKELEESYHSVHGAVGESKHVYIKNGFERFKNLQDEIHILEIGFGTGLNALLTIDNCLLSSKIFYTALEPFPLNEEILKNYYNTFEVKPNSLAFLSKMISANTNIFTSINSQFNFCLKTSKIQDFKYENIEIIYKNSHTEFNGFDLIYYDAFAPNKQSEMWTEKAISNATNLLKETGIIVTYCAQGAYKRILKNLNLIVENPKGLPPKREITVGIKQNK